MIKRNIFLTITLLIPLILNAKGIDQDSVKSKILNRSVSFSIYLPDGYDSEQRSYPVIYLLHGYGDNHTTWIDKGNISWYADSAIKSGKIPPVIIVMPDAGVSMYVNSFDNKNSYEDFFIKEFIPSIESSYRIKKNKYSRGITGHSMGGWGCMLYALKYPDLFIASAPMSAGIHDDKDIVTYDNGKWEVVFGSIFGHNLESTERLNEAWYKNSILKIVEEMPQSDLQKVRIRISSGDQDFLLKGSILLHQALSKQGINHQLRIKDGSHTWAYWRSDITDVLEFIAGNFW
jgi:S-formylglutathione hydrolase FrmB